MGLWCRHQRQTSPRRDEKGEYLRCLDCGKRIPWSWPDRFPMIRPPKMRQARETSSAGRALAVVWGAQKKSA